MTNNTVEEIVDGSPKDIALQLLAYLRSLEHGMSEFHGQWVMECSEEETFIELVEHALTKALQEEREHTKQEIVEWVSNKDRHFLGNPAYINVDDLINHLTTPHHD